MQSSSTMNRPAQQHDERGLVALLRRSWAINWPLTLTGGLMLLTLLAALIGMIVDPRIITGQPAWLKPAKFALSIAIYAFTFVWMLSFVRGGWQRRLADFAAGTTAVALLLEMAIIALQVVRGTGSHFNIATTFDTLMFSIMGVMITTLWVMGLILALLLLLQRIAPPPLAWGLRLGMIISMIGAAQAFLMTIPTAEQQAAMAAGERVTVAGAHAVGAPDDASGMPITGWSTTGGDLRIGHFVGLHAMQVLPLLGWLLSQGRAGFLGSLRRRSRLLGIASGGYLGLVILFTWQALRGQPLLAPDDLTLAAFAGLAAIVGIAGATLLWRREKRV